jgi:hypothetical protein
MKIIRMKALSITLLMVALSVCSFAQTKKTTIFCDVTSDGKVFYYDLNKILPDSLSATLLVDPKKDHKFKNDMNVLMWMSLHGWNLRSILSNDRNYVHYLLSRDIELDDNARALFAASLENQVKK